LKRPRLKEPEANTSWSEATQQHYCVSTTQIWKKKYGGKDSKYKKAHKEATVAYCKKHPFSHLKSQRDKDLGHKKK